MFDQILQRLIRIVKLDQTVYQEIEHDENANTEAIYVVVAATLLAFIGSLIAGLVNRTGVGGAFVELIVGPLSGWLLWSWLTMFIGTRLFNGEADFWEMARLLGYAYAPRAVGLLAFIPCLGGLAGLAGAILSLIVGFFAVREGLDLPTEKAILTIVIGWVVIMVVSIVIGLILGTGAAVFGAIG